MPLRQITHTIAADNTLEILTTAMNEQTIEAASCRLVNTVTGSNVAKAQIGLCQGGITLAHRMLILAEGYLDNTSSVYWSGNLLVPADCHLYVAVIGIADYQIRFSIILHDYEPRPLRKYSETK